MRLGSGLLNFDLFLFDFQVGQNRKMMNIVHFKNFLEPEVDYH